MTGCYLTAPALLGHLFLRRGQDMREPTQHLVAAWDAVTSRFGLDDGIAALGVPRRLARGYRIDPGETGLIAAAESGAESVWQACAWAGHGVLGVSAMLAPPRDRDCPGQWADLERRWEQALAAGPGKGVLGEARLFLALLAGGPDGEPFPGPDTAATVAQLLRAAVPAPSAPGWWQRWDTATATRPDGDGPPAGVLIWEAGPAAADARASRRLACVTPDWSERLADRVLWTAGDGTPSPLTRHLAHAAALRYQVSVYDGGAPARRTRDEIGQLIDELPAAAGRAGDDVTASAAVLLQARASAITLRHRLTAMRHAVGILGDNLRQALPGPDSGPAPGTGPLTDDRDLAGWLQRRLDDEVALVDEAAASAAAAAELLAGASAAAAPAPTAPAPAAPAAAGRAPRAPAGWAAAPDGSRPAGRGARVAVVFTAIGVEYRAVREHLDATVRHEEHGALFEVGELAGAGGPWLVALAETGAGSTAAALQLERAVRVFDPEIAIFVGVAGGRKDARLGDVVVADKIYDYEWGKSTLAGFEPRPRTHQPAHRLLLWARSVANEDRWQRRVRPASPARPPTCHVKPIVTGSKVIAHDQSETALQLGRFAGDAVAVDMEGYGFLEAAYLNPRVDALVIRGISDRLTGKTKRGDDRWQPAASRHAAAFAVEFLNIIGERAT
jgi:nucleoside phosphorylase